MESLICITLTPQFNITGMTKNGLHFLGYSDFKELEFRSIADLIPMPSSALHAQIFAEMQKTYSDKEKYFEIAKIGDSTMNDRVHATSPAEVLERLEDPHAVKWVMTKSGKQKRAGIYIDMKTDRFVDVYMLPLPESPSGSRSASPVPRVASRETLSRSLSDSDSDSSVGSKSGSRVSARLNKEAASAHHHHHEAATINGHFELRNAPSTPALVSVLRAIKDL
jgi:hypothetical protein